MQAQVSVATHEILGLGEFPGGSRDASIIEIVDIPDTELYKLRQLGSKFVDGKGVITVVAPPPPPPPPPIPDYGDDATPDQAQLVAAVVALRQYLQQASPTAPQSAAALKMLIRVVLFVAKRLVG